MELNTRVLQPKKLLKMVEEELDIKNLKTKDRSRDIYQARFIYFKLARTHCRYASLTKIGKTVDRDHATVINGLKKYDMEAKYDPYMNDVYDKISSKVDSKYVAPGRTNEVDMTFERLNERVEQLEKQLNKFVEWKN